METCKLCVSIPGKSLKIDMPRPDAEVWFTTLADALLNNQPEPEPDEDQEDEPTYATLEDPVEKAAWAVPEEAEDTQETAPPKSVIDVEKNRARTVEPESDQSDERDGYKGFLRIRCVKCGKLKSFCTKKRLSGYYCECGGYTILDDLVDIDARCGVCGHTWGYRTNNTTQLDEITCLECGAPITLEQDKYGDYQTIGMK